MITNKDALEQWLNEQDYDNANLLLMSSGNYDGLDIVKFAEEQIKYTSRNYTLTSILYTNTLKC